MVYDHFVGVPIIEIQPVQNDQINLTLEFKALNTLHISFYCSRGNDQRYSMQIPTIIMIGICMEYF